MRGGSQMCDAAGNSLANLARARTAIDEAEKLLKEDHLTEYLWKLSDAQREVNGAVHWSANLISQKAMSLGTPLL